MLISIFTVVSPASSPSDACRSAPGVPSKVINMPCLRYEGNFHICGWQSAWKKSRMRGINNLKYDLHYAPRSSLHIPNFSVIQVQHLLTVAMHHGWNSTNDTCILHFFFLIPCICFLDMSGQQWAFILCFCLSSSQYSNDLTLLSLLGNDDDDACGFYSLAGTPVNYPLA